MADTTDSKDTNSKNSGDSPTPHNEFFNQQWKIYQKILSSNYMEHCEFYGVLHEFLVQYFQKPFKMLDLGCGDASFVAQALTNTNITFYQGIDLSEAALNVANDRMAIIPCQKIFTHNDFSKFVPELVKNQQNRFDVVLASFALHHLTLEQKDNLMGQLFQLLKTNGIFLLIDLVCQEREHRAAYIKRYLQGVRKEWSLLTPQEVLMVNDHISSSDFPETQKNLRLIAQKNGFRKVECFYQDRLNTSQLLCFYTNDSNRISDVKSYFRFEM